MKDKCPKCNSELKKIDLKKRGWIAISLIPAVIIFEIFLVSGTSIPIFWPMMFAALGIYFIRKKERFIFNCKKCVKNYKEQEIKT